MISPGWNATIIHGPEIWGGASGHVDTFADLMVEDSQCTWTRSAPVPGLDVITVGAAKRHGYSSKRSAVMRATPVNN